MHYSACVMSAGGNREEWLCRRICLLPMEYFPKHSYLLWQWSTFHNKKTRHPSHIVVNCWNTFPCKGDLTLSRWRALLWAAIACQSFFIVGQNCTNLPREPPPSRRGSWLNGCTSHVGNEPPLFLSRGVRKCFLLRKPLKRVLQFSWCV